MMVAIALFGAAGAICRFLMSSIVGKFAKGYSLISTTVINIIGSLLLGICYGFSIKYPAFHALYVLISVGFLGAFTTFSTFSYEGYILYNESKIKGIAFICFSIVCASFGVSLGVHAVI